MGTEPACCNPSRADAEPAGIAAESPGAPARSLGGKSKGPPTLTGMVSLDGGASLMGAEGPESIPADREGPVREVVVDPFWIDSCAVSNLRFEAFVDATGYATDAERYGWSFVFGGPAPRRVSGHSRRRRRRRGGARSTAPAGANRRGRIPRLDDRLRSPRRSRLLARRRGLLRMEPARGCRARPSGSTRLAAGWCRSTFPGATSWSRVASTG